MQYVLAALGGLMIAVTAGFAVGFHRDKPDDPSGRAAYYAASISESMNCSVLFAVMAVPAAVVITRLKRKKARKQRDR
jgi:hypothetical protein